jgi:hypothetical protein
MTKRDRLNAALFDKNLLTHWGAAVSANPQWVILFSNIYDHDGLVGR